MWKKTLTWVSGVVTIVLVVVAKSGLAYNYCPTPSVPCTDLINDTLQDLFIFLPVFILSLITYRLSEKATRAWMYFAIPWTVLSIIATHITPEYGGGGGFGLSMSIDKSDVAFLMSALFVIISTLIIGAMYVRTWMGNKKV